MRKNQLTPVEVKNLNETGRYADGGGLYLQVTRWEKAGEEWATKAWLFRFMLNGRAREMGLGSADVFTLAEARERAKAQRKLLADRIDPLEQRKRAHTAAKLEAARAITFADAAEAYIGAHSAGWRNEKHVAQWSSTIETYANPTIGSLPVAEIDTALVVKILQPIWTSKNETAGRLRGRIERVLDWATVSGYRQGPNPARWKGHLDKLLTSRKQLRSVKPVRHHPAMAYKDLPAFMADLRKRDGISAKALEFVILTCTRTGESLGATWDEIDRDEKLWRIPKERMKANKPHTVPLTDRALKILDSLPRVEGCPYLFPGAIEGKGLSNMACLELMREMAPAYVPHGFRSSFRDWAAESTSFPSWVAEAALAHVVADKVEAAYRRGDLIAKRRKLAEAWEGYLAKPQPAGKVVPMKARAG